MTFVILKLIFFNNSESEWIVMIWILTCGYAELLIIRQTFVDVFLSEEEKCNIYIFKSSQVDNISFLKY